MGWIWQFWRNLASHPVVDMLTSCSLLKSSIPWSLVRPLSKTQENIMKLIFTLTFIWFLIYAFNNEKLKRARYKYNFNWFGYIAIKIVGHSNSRPEFIKQDKIYCVQTLLKIFLRSVGLRFWPISCGGSYQKLTLGPSTCLQTIKIYLHLCCVQDPNRPRAQQSRHDLAWQ